MRDSCPIFIQDLSKKAAVLSKAELQPAVRSLAVAVQQSAAPGPAGAEGSSLEDQALLLRTFQILLSQVSAPSENCLRRLRELELQSLLLAHGHASPAERLARAARHKC